MCKDMWPERNGENSMAAKGNVLTRQACNLAWHGIFTLEAFANWGVYHPYTRPNSNVSREYTIDALASLCKGVSYLMVNNLFTSVFFPKLARIRDCLCVRNLPPRKKWTILFPTDVCHGDGRTQVKPGDWCIVLHYLATISTTHTVYRSSKPRFDRLTLGCVFFL